MATIGQRRQRIHAIARIAVISVLVSGLITIVLTRVFFGEVLKKGMLIALVCAGPLSVWIARRELRMRDVIARQRDDFQRGSHADVAGHGLGLAIVKRIVDRLGGAAGVRAAPDQGALFWFSLPAVPAGAASAKTSLLV